MGYNYYYGGSSATIIAVCAVLGLIGGIVLLFTFLPKRNEGRYDGFLGWLYQFLHFKKLLAEVILRVLYVISACVITMVAVGSLIAGQFVAFLVVLIVGNVASRLGYEFMLVILLICKNTADISEKLGGASSSIPFADPIDPIVPQPAPPPPPPAPASAPVPVPPEHKCPTCGAEVDADAAFCPQCGAKLK
ncbi:MAG: zinc ribbon domain-containing protein [Oscillospiraceae bacterium]|jgi:hypothetical protein|nr:zinc ribbon domain-containing protein [Oscillospiraceae bacterium]